MPLFGPPNMEKLKDHTHGLSIYEAASDEAAFVDRLTTAQIKEFSRHTLTSRLSPVLVWLLHFPTLGAFTVIYFGLKHSRLPRIEKMDWGAWWAIGLMCVPILNVIWSYPFWFGLARRLTFQYWIRGLAAPFYVRPSIVTETVLGAIFAGVVGDTGIVYFLITHEVDVASAIAFIAASSYVISWFVVSGIPAPALQIVANDLAAIERAGSGFDPGSRVLRTDSEDFAALPKRPSRVPGWAQRLFWKGLDTLYLYQHLGPFERQQELLRREEILRRHPEAAERWLFPEVKASRRESKSERQDGDD